MPTCALRATRALDMVRAHTGRNVNDHPACLHDDGIAVRRADRRGVDVHLHRNERRSGGGLTGACGAAPTIELLRHQPMATGDFCDIGAPTVIDCTVISVV